MWHRCNNSPIGGGSETVIDMFIVAPKSSATYTFTKDSETAIVVAGGGTGYGIVTLNGAAIPFTTYGADNGKGYGMVKSGIFAVKEGDVLSIAYSGIINEGYIIAY